jgi:hypothetical protein
MPKVDRYVVYNIGSKKYYCIGTNENNDCSVNINKATTYTREEFTKYSRIGYLRRDERFVNIDQDGKKTIINR